MRDDTEVTLKRNPRQTDREELRKRHEMQRGIDSAVVTTRGIEVRKQCTLGYPRLWCV